MRVYNSAGYLAYVLSDDAGAGEILWEITWAAAGAYPYVIARQGDRARASGVLLIVR